MSQRRNYPLSGGFYRWIRDLDTPWEASPIITDSPDAFEGLPWNPLWIREGVRTERAKRLGARSKTKGIGDGVGI